jgi:hypothetical protein
MNIAPNVRDLLEGHISLEFGVDRHVYSVPGPKGYVPESRDFVPKGRESLINV